MSIIEVCIGECGFKGLSVQAAREQMTSVQPLPANFWATSAASSGPTAVLEACSFGAACSLPVAFLLWKLQQKVGIIVLSHRNTQSFPRQGMAPTTALRKTGDAYWLDSLFLQNLNDMLSNLLLFLFPKRENIVKLELKPSKISV